MEVVIVVVVVVAVLVEVKRNYRGMSSVTETSSFSNLSMAGIILLFSATDDISSSLFLDRSIDSVLYQRGG